jgi:hypothetical protein
MNSDRWRELKQKLTDEADLSEIWLYYMDHFADHPKFTNMGSRVDDPYLDAVTLSICQHLFGANATIANALTICIAQQRFYHGPFMVGGRIGGIIYDENTKTGLLAVSADASNDGMMQYSRFSKPIELPPPPDDPNLN